jgi:hypothetical protein
MSTDISLQVSPPPPSGLGSQASCQIYQIYLTDPHLADANITNLPLHRQM